MTDTSEPRTEAGRAHRRYLHAIVHGPNPDGSFDCRNGCECSDDILAIEAEAAASRHAALDVENLARDLRGAVSNLPEQYGGFGLVRRTEVDDALVTVLQRWAARLASEVE